MGNPSQPSKPKKRYRDHGDDGISWDKINKCYVGTISLGFKRRQAQSAGPCAARPRPKSRTISTSSTTRSTLASVRRPPTPSSSASKTGSTRSSATTTRWPPGTARPRSGSIRRSARRSSRTSRPTDAEKFFDELAGSLGKRSMVMIKSTLRRSIRRAQVHNLIGRNVVELIDLPAGQAGHPSRAMTEAQAAKVLKTASGKANRLRQGREGQQGPLRCDPRCHRDRRPGVRHQAAQGRADHRSEPRTEGSNLPLMPHPTRHRRDRQRQPPTRSPLRSGDHARPAPWRAAPAHLGPRRRRPGE